MLLMYNYVLLKMSTWYSKHVEESNNIWRINNIQCIALVVLYGRMSELGGHKICEFTLKVVMQTDRDFVNIVLLYLFLPLLLLAVRSNMHWITFSVFSCTSCAIYNLPSLSEHCCVWVSSFSTCFLSAGEYWTYLSRYFPIGKEDVPTWCKQFYYDFFS